jgi:hypothetical protein
MIPIARSVLAVFLGMISSFFLILAIEVLGGLAFPPPPGLDSPNAETAAAAWKLIAPGMFAIVLVAWAVGTFIGAGIAARIAPRWKVGHGMIIGVLLLLASINQMGMFPHPLWVWVVGVAEFLPVAYLGAKLVTAAPARPVPTAEGIAGPADPS